MSKFSGGRSVYLTEPQIRQAMSLTRSNQQAAVYLKVSFPTYKKYAKLFKDKNGASLFDLHKNQSGRGMIKPREDDRKFKLDDILMGKHPTYPKDKLFRRIIASNYMPEKCSHCNYHTRRATDLKIPLLFHHINGNVTDHRLDNLEILCYNCYFTLIGNINTATLRNTERYIKTSADANVTYAAANGLSVDPNESFDDVLSDQEKMDMIKAIKGL
tara:strand:+ start:1232 stop:1876 length:645 start_codon:yes stop_codon:yes gene_type:complete